MPASARTGSCTGTPSTRSSPCRRRWRNTGLAICAQRVGWVEFFAKPIAFANAVLGDTGRRNGVHRKTMGFARAQPILRRLATNKRLEQRQRPDFDAFARARAGRRGRILEGRVGGPARHAVLARIVDL